MSLPVVRFDPAKITSHYGLLGAFLLVVQVLMVTWVVRAEGGIERAAAGLLAVGVLSIFLFILLRLERSPTVAPYTSLPNPAGKEAPLEEIRSPEPEILVGPDSSFTIRQPPDGWQVTTTTLAEMAIKRFNVPATLAASARPIVGLPPDSDEQAMVNKRNVLVISSSRDLMAFPVPGETTINGRHLPTLLGVPLPTRLSIVPLERMQAPYYIQLPLVHNFLQVAGGMMEQGTILSEIQLNPISTNHMLKIVATFKESAENVLIDGGRARAVTTNTLFGISGNIRDYVLIMTQSEVFDIEARKLQEDVQILHSIVESFRPVAVQNPEEARIQAQQVADEQFEQFSAKLGVRSFLGQFVTVMLQMGEFDVSDVEQRLIALKLLKPFGTYARNAVFDTDTLEELELTREDLIEMLDDVQSAIEEGDRVAFKEHIDEVVAGLTDPERPELQEEDAETPGDNMTETAS
jgi:hypothetical protein